jgi:hypothetical protein
MGVIFMLTRRVPRYVGTFIALFGCRALAQVSVEDRIAVKNPAISNSSKWGTVVEAHSNHCLTIRLRNQVPMAMSTKLASHKLTAGHAPFLVIDKDKPRTG